MAIITRDDLETMPTLAVGQTADLKIDTGTMRIWLSRCSPEDGETQPVQVEWLRCGRWVDVGAPGNTVSLNGEYAGDSVYLD